MITTRFILPVAAALAFTACKEKPAPAAGSSGSEAKPVMAVTAESKPAFTVPDTFKAALGKVYDGYAEIQAALANDDLAQAKAAFATMHAVLHMMPKEGLDASAQAYWDSTDVRIMTALHPMASAETLDSVRIQFMAFSDVMADAIGKFGLVGEVPVYRFHCPMAADNKGADWLQKHKEVRNPYYGKSMLTCGTLVESPKS